MRASKCIVLPLLLWVACGGEESPPGQQVVARSSDTPPVVVVPSTKGAVAKPVKERAPFELIDLEIEGKESNALRSMGALSAWSAVHERHRLLERRGEKGLVFGTLVEHEQQLLLVDESTGQGTLAIPVALPEGVSFPLPRRVVTAGTWVVDEEKWLWKVESVQGLSEKKPGKKLPSLIFDPGLQPRELSMKKKFYAPSKIPTGGGIIFFRVAKSPRRSGDGWTIRDLGAGPPVARLRLPGEKASYGNQSTLSDEERWQLVEGQRYWVEISRFRARKLGVLPTFDAISIPSRMRAKSVQTKQN